MPIVPHKQSSNGKHNGSPVSPGSEMANRLRQHFSKQQQPKGATKPEPTTIYTASEILAMELPEPKCIIHTLLTEGLNILVSPPKTGKSWFSLQAGIAVASGGIAFGSLPAMQGDVLYLALEDNHRRLKSRLNKRLAGKPVPARLELVTQWPRLDEGGLEQLAEWSKGVECPGLILLDTLAMIRSLKSGQADRYTADYHAMCQLKQFADEHNITLLVNHHDRKAEGTDALDAVSGTKGITGAVDTILLLKRERGELDASLYITGRDIDEHEVALDWDQEHCGWIKSDGEARDLRMSKERKEVLDCVRQHGPITPKEVAEQLGKKREAIRRLLTKLAAANELKATAAASTQR